MPLYSLHKLEIKYMLHASVPLKHMFSILTLFLGFHFSRTHKTWCFHCYTQEHNFFPCSLWQLHHCYKIPPRNNCAETFFFIMCFLLLSFFPPPLVPCASLVPINLVSPISIPIWGAETKEGNQKAMTGPLMMPKEHQGSEKLTVPKLELVERLLIRGRIRTPQLELWDHWLGILVLDECWYRGRYPLASS